MEIPHGGLCQMHLNGAVLIDVLTRWGEAALVNDFVICHVAAYSPFLAGLYSAK